MVKILIGFVGGVIYGVMYAVEVPDGIISKAAAIIKMFIWG